MIFFFFSQIQQHSFLYLSLLLNLHFLTELRRGGALKLEKNEKDSRYVLQQVEGKIQHGNRMFSAKRLFSFAKQKAVKCVNCSFSIGTLLVHQFVKCLFQCFAVIKFKLIRNILSRILPLKFLSFVLID